MDLFILLNAHLHFTMRRKIFYKNVFGEGISVFVSRTNLVCKWGFTGFSGEFSAVR